MGIFSKKKEKAAKPTKAVKPAKVAKQEKAATTPAVKASVSANRNNHVIIRPRITEKATLKADAENVFVFEIAEDATKQQVSNAVASIYNVRPVKIAIVRNPKKNVYYRGHFGVTAGVKKAYVYLKKGEKIEIV